MDTFNKNITDILQLYEFSMAIGKSLDYKENCDSLLKLIMSRKGLHSCWIYAFQNSSCSVTYSIPAINNNEVPACNKGFLKEIHSRNKHMWFPISDDIRQIAPLTLVSGCVAVFNLKNEGLLFLHYSKKQEFTEIELNQLGPIIDKFTLSLQASTAFAKQKQLFINLEKQNQELSDYTHLVSHDLKSPLRNIEALTTWIRDDFNGALEEKDTRTFDLISANLEKMDALIDGILKYSTLDKDNSESYPINLNELVTQIIKDIAVPSNIDVVFINELPVIRGDKYRLQQVFLNLIVNAIKYNDKETGLIEIGSRTVAQGHEFFVRDNGTGIDKAFKHKIFEMFQSLESDSQGTGIGLSIAKKVVSYYKGDIWFDSKLGEGSTFYFTLYDNGAA